MDAPELYSIYIFILVLVCALNLYISCTNLQNKAVFKKRSMFSSDRMYFPFMHLCV